MGRPGRPRLLPFPTEPIKRIGYGARNEFAVLVVLQLGEVDLVRDDLAAELHVDQAHDGMGGHLAMLG